MCVCVCVSQTLSFALAEREGATVVLANDPDADRLAAAEKQDRSVPIFISYGEKMQTHNHIYGLRSEETNFASI